MTKTQQQRTVIAIILVAILSLGTFLYERTRTEVDAYGIPKILRTPGGTFEIVALEVNEIFKLKDPSFLRGTTESEVRVPAFFRFHIELAEEWPISNDGKVITVRTNPVKPTLPVAIKTNEMEVSTKSGWARFDKHQNLAVLEKSISPELNVRANSSRLREMALTPGRETVKEFVKTWMLKDKRFQSNPEMQIKVIFPDDVKDPSTL